MSKLTLVKAASAVAFLTIVSKILGFVREASLAAVFGATADTDAYLLAQTIPVLLFATISYALTTTFIPVYSHVKVKSGDEAAFRFANSVIWIVSLVGLLLVLGGEFFAGPLVRMVAPGLDAYTAELTKYLSQIIFPMMVFQLISGVFTGILQANGEFVIPTVAGLAQNVCIIGSILVFGPRYGIAAVAAGTVFGAAISAAMKLPAARRVGFTCKLSFSIKDPGVRRMAVLVIPAILGAGANQINTLVDRILASGLPEGRIAALNYAMKLMQLAPGIIGTTIVTVTYPRLARTVARKDWESFTRDLVSSLSVIHFMLVPIAIGVMVLREPLVRVIFERGVFDTSATKETAWALLFLSLGIAIFSMRDLVSRAFFTLQDTRTPMILGFVTVGVNVALNLILVGPLEQGGLALATTLASSVGLILGLVMLMRKSPSGFPIGTFLSSTLRCGVAGAGMGAIVAVLNARIYQVIDVNGTIYELAVLIVLGCVGASVYFAFARLLRVPEYTILRDRITRGLGGIVRNQGAEFDK